MNSWRGKNILGSTTVEDESRLIRIKKSCLSNCQLRLICIPRNVEILDKSCFVVESVQWGWTNLTGLESIPFENESRLMRIEQSYFLNCPLKSICIPHSVKIPGKSCFVRDEYTQILLKWIKFESKPRLIQIEESCFLNCSLKSICIPRDAEVLGKACFARDVYRKLCSNQKYSRVNHKWHKSKSHGFRIMQ
jgi:hypothetical protein